MSDIRPDEFQIGDEIEYTGGNLDWIGARVVILSGKYPKFSCRTTKETKGSGKVGYVQDLWVHDFKLISRNGVDMGSKFAVGDHIKYVRGPREWIGARGVVESCTSGSSRVKLTQDCPSAGYNKGAVVHLTNDNLEKIGQETTREAQTKKTYPTCICGCGEPVYASGFKAWPHIAMYDKQDESRYDTTYACDRCWMPIGGTVHYYGCPCIDDPNIPLRVPRGDKSTCTHKKKVKKEYPYKCHCGCGEPVAIKEFNTWACCARILGYLPDHYHSTQLCDRCWSGRVGVHTPGCPAENGDYSLRIEAKSERATRVETSRELSSGSFVRHTDDPTLGGKLRTDKPTNPGMLWYTDKFGKDHQVWDFEVEVGKPIGFDDKEQ